MIRLILLAFILLGCAAAGAQPLSQNRTVTEGLVAVGMALEIDARCESLSARKLRGLLLLRDLRAAARDAGASDAQIDAYVDDPVEKARLEAEARARLADLGAIPEDGASYCAVGRALIAQASPAGRLLRD